MLIHGVQQWVLRALGRTGLQLQLPSGLQVQQVWVEFRACEKGNVALLRLLNRTHAIYDMRWWGVPKTRWPTYDFAKDFWAEGMPRADERPDTRPPSGSAASDTPTRLATWTQTSISCIAVA